MPRGKGPQALQTSLPSDMITMDAVSVLAQAPSVFDKDRMRFNHLYYF